MKMLPLAVITTLVLMQMISLNAQDFSYGDSPLTPEQYQFIQQAYQNPPPAVLNGDISNKVAIKAWVVNDAIGFGGATDRELVKALSFLNDFYFEAGIEFYYCGGVTSVNNQDLFEYNTDAPDLDSEAALVAATGSVTNAVNLYVVDAIRRNGSNIPAYTYLPLNDNNDENRILITRSALTKYPNGTFAHEFGHYFSLLNTDEGTENGPLSSNAEHVARTGADANCDTAGDFFCDTAADPGYDSSTPDFDQVGCNYSGTQTDAFGSNYNPPTNNIMSSYPDVCGGVFTEEQEDAIEIGFNIRDGHSTYDITACTPPTVSVPTNLTIAINSDDSGLVIEWTDNANNELGYLLERSSTSATTDFEPFQYLFTGPNGTSCTDYNLSPNTQYWYRIKAANGDPDTYSTVATYTTGLVYCGAISEDCDEYISRVRVGSGIGAIDNSSICSPDGYGNFTGINMTVEEGTNYPVTVNNGMASTGDICGLWVDWNKDGDFDEMNESFTMSGGPNTFTGTITVPSGAAGGLTRMRTRIAFEGTPEWCGIERFGETEDYLLNVVLLLPVELIQFEGQLEGQTILLNWATASEINNDFFQVEKSGDGKNFYPIGKVPGQGTTSSTSNYHLVDETPLTAWNYYRLKQVDFDGQFEYSKIISVRYDEIASNWRLFPNPVQDQFQLFRAFSGDHLPTIQLFNAAGQQQEASFLSKGDETSLTIHVQELPSGIYYLQVQDNHLSTVLKFVKQ